MIERCDWCASSYAPPCGDCIKRAQTDLQAQLKAAQDALDAVTKRAESAEAERDALKQLVASLRRPKLDYSKDKPGGAA